MLLIQNLDLTFHLDRNEENDKHAINNLNIEFEDGQFVTIIGSNGSGKSTLLNAIAGSLKVDKGTIILKENNQDIDLLKLNNHKRAKYIGRVFQDPMIGTIGDMGIDENLSLATRRGKINTLRWAINKKQRQEMANMLSSLHLDLENNLKAKMKTLSGGQRQSITLLMASVNKPRILLLDEHTAALDPKTAVRVMELTKEIVSKLPSTITIMVTHNMNDAIKYGNRLIMLNEGKIIYDVKGNEKAKLTVDDLIEKFKEKGGTVSDTQVLAN